MLETLADEAKEDFVSTVLSFLTWQPPEWDIATSRYTEDNELWWYNPRPLSRGVVSSSYFPFLSYHRVSRKPPPAQYKIWKGGLFKASRFGTGRIL